MGRRWGEGGYVQPVSRWDVISGEKVGRRWGEGGYVQGVSRWDVISGEKVGRRWGEGGYVQGLSRWDVFLQRSVHLHASTRENCNFHIVRDKHSTKLHK